MDRDDGVCSLIDDAVRAFRDEYGLPSVVLGLSDGSERLYVSAAAAPGQQVPGAETPYRIASMTKSFTAAAVLVLRDQGRLRLDDPIAALAPELRTVVGPTADSPAVTVRHLLSMSSGLAGDDPWADRLLDADEATLDALFAAGARFGLTPGTGFLYANLGYVMLGRIVATVAGMPYQDFVTGALLQPLGLHATTWHSPLAPPAAPAPAYWLEDGELVAEPVLADGGFAPMGGLWSTTADLARWCRWLLDAFPPRDDADEGILSRASRRELQQVVTAWPPEVSTDEHGQRVLAGGYGLGLNVAVDSRLGSIVQHGGGIPGFGSDMRWLPERGVAAVALANLRYAPARHLTLTALDLVTAVRPSPSAASKRSAESRPDGSAGSPGPNLASGTVNPELRGAVESLVALLNDWRADRAEVLFSFNVDLDESLDRRERAARQRLDAHGPLVVQSITPLNRAEADVSVSDRGGQPLTLSLMLSPEPALRIQWYELARTDQPGPN